MKIKANINFDIGTKNEPPTNQNQKTNDTCKVEQQARNTLEKHGKGTTTFTHVQISVFLIPTSHIQRSYIRFQLLAFWTSDV